MASKKRTRTAAEVTGDRDTLAMLLRTGGGKHGDRRTKRNRDRSSQRRAAIRDGY